MKIKTGQSIKIVTSEEGFKDGTCNLVKCFLSKTFFVVVKLGESFWGFFCQPEFHVVSKVG